MSDTFARFRYELLQWHSSIFRDLPWKESKDPYKIWISEIILQQTRVEQGRGYYLRFIDRFPDVDSLAEANLEDVLVIWKGLGYYSRARNLHYTAQVISKELNGEFPRHYNDLLNLKGIGPYTAAAISSFAFGQAYPVIDGNVIRVLSRIHGVSAPVDKAGGKQQIKELGELSLSRDQPAEYNQAIMDFGALVCKPANPQCESCPLSTICVAFRSGTPKAFPVKSKSKEIRNRYFHYLWIQQGDTAIIVEKRDQKDIWRDLYELPQVETSKSSVSPNQLKEMFSMKYQEQLMLNSAELVDEKTQQLSHQIITARFYRAQAITRQKTLSALPLSKAKTTPFPKIVDDFISTILEGSLQ